MKPSRLAVAAAATLLTVGLHAADLVVGLGADVTSIDPHYLNAGPNSSIADQVFDRLVANDARQRPQPSLAESWRLVNDTTWEFKLRRGVKFHDGSDFTADDVVFSLDRPATLKDAPGGFITFTQAIAEKTVVDPLTIRFRTRVPYPNLPVDMAAIHMLSRKAAQGASSADFDSGKAAIGAGPYRLVRFAKGDRIEFVRHDGYWGPRPQWDKVTLRIITSDPSRVAALAAGDVQVIEAVPTQDVARLKANPNVSIFSTASNRMIFLLIDSDRDRSPYVADKAGKPLERNPLKDVRVRRALSKAINRQALVERVMEGAAVQAGQFMPEGFFGYANSLKPDPFDPDGARKLLAEAGYPDGFMITLHGPNNRYVNDDQILQAVAQMWARVGVQTRVEALPFAVYMSRAQKLEFSAGLLGWGVSTGEATYPLRSLVATFTKEKGWGTFNPGRYSNKRVDELLDQATSTMDNARRERLLQEATEVAIRDQAIIPLHYQVNLWAARKPFTYEPRTDERTHANGVRH